MNGNILYTKRTKKQAYKFVPVKADSEKQMPYLSVQLVTAIKLAVPRSEVRILFLYMLFVSIFYPTRTQENKPGSIDTRGDVSST